MLSFDSQVPAYFSFPLGLSNVPPSPKKGNFSSTFMSQMTNNCSTSKIRVLENIHNHDVESFLPTRMGPHVWLCPSYYYWVTLKTLLKSRFFIKLENPILGPFWLKNFKTKRFPKKKYKLILNHYTNVTS